MSKGRWLSEMRADPWHRKAKSEGFPSRAAYKLAYVQKKYGLLKRGDIVVELGAAPGGMTKYESNIVGEEGYVLAVDTKPLSFSAENVGYLKLDVMEEGAEDEILEALGNRRSDVLVCDASPRFTGVREVDVLTQLELTIRALEISDYVVRREGNVLIKALESEELRNVEVVMRKGFAFYKRVITPPSLRKRSSEVYLLGKAKRFDGISLLMRRLT